ncbi:MAG: hypothetical protein JRJ29_14640, partial [Deltaproteobacteria bacterium]|nr:hypothetical protein [Deltaproteobacteria bacterium]
MKGIKRVIYPILPLVILCFLLFPGKSLGGVETGLIDFGQVLVDEEAKAGLTISNEGQTSYTIYLTLDSQTGSFSMDYSGAFTLAPGGSKEIVIYFKPLVPGMDSATLTVGYYEGWT